MILVIDIPVQAAEQRGTLTADVTLSVRIRVSGHGFIAVDDGLSGFLGKEIVISASIECLRVRVFLVFIRCEEEQLVLHDRATQGKAIGLCSLISKLDLLVQMLIVSAIHALVCVVTESGTGELVRTRFGDGVDCSTSEAALTNVERRYRDLNLVDGIE